MPSLAISRLAPTIPAVSYRVTELAFLGSMLCYISSVHILRDDKLGAIQASTTQILELLNIPLESWLKITNEFMDIFKGPVGRLPDLQHYCEHQGMQRVAHASSCQHWTS